MNGNYNYILCCHQKYSNRLGSKQTECAALNENFTMTHIGGRIKKKVISHVAIHKELHVDNVHLQCIITMHYRKILNKKCA